MNKDELSFEKWFEELSRIALERYGVTVACPSVWREFYDDGVSPKDAIEAESD